MYHSRSIEGSYHQKVYCKYLFAGIELTTLMRYLNIEHRVVYSSYKAWCESAFFHSFVKKLTGQNLDLDNACTRIA